MLFRLASNWNCLQRCASRAFEGVLPAASRAPCSLLAPLGQVGNRARAPLDANFGVAVQAKPFSSRGPF